MGRSSRKDLSSDAEFDKRPREASLSEGAVKPAEGPSSGNDKNDVCFVQANLLWARFRYAKVVILLFSHASLDCIVHWFLFKSEVLLLFPLIDKSPVAGDKILWQLAYRFYCIIL